MEMKKENEDRSNEQVDRLTGIYNRVGFYAATEKLFAENPDTEFLMVYWNVRRFKAINELFGWNVGDIILIEMAKRIKKQVKPYGGTYGRLERDNFILCFPSELIHDDNFVESGDISYVKDDTVYHFSSCFGLYKIEDKSRSIESMVDKSRLAMDAVTGNYMQPYAFYDESMSEKLLMEQILMSDCETAIKENQFKVYYQPLCSAIDGTIASAEALVRWEHPKKGMISPGDFIPVFEKTGFVCVLDRYVWDAVCRMIKQRMDEKKECVPISVNVSRMDFYKQSLSEDIIGIVKKYNIKPELLRIEITESAYSDNPERVMEIVKELQDFGFQILMDDFGSGYSSLNTLKDLPVDILKIDMKFMDDLSDGEKSAVILESIVRMAKWMNLKTVAEGVETLGELNFLKSVECNYIQGFYFYRPMPEKEFIEILDKPELIDIKSAAVIELNRKDFSTVYSETMYAEEVFQGMAGGMGIYELVGDRIEIIRVNKGYYEIMKSNEFRINSEERLISNYIPENEYRMLVEKCLEAEESKATKQLQVHRKTWRGDFIWLDVRIRFLGSSGKRKMFYFYLLDITEIKEKEKNDYLKKYTNALFLVFDKVYYMDYATGMTEVLYSIDENMKVGEKFVFFELLKNFEKHIVDIKNKQYMEVVKSREALDSAIGKSGSGKVSLEFRINEPDIDYEWISVTFLRIESDVDKLDYIICVKRI